MDQRETIDELKELIEQVEDKLQDLDWNICEQVIAEIKELSPYRVITSKCCKERAGMSIEIPIEDIYYRCTCCGSSTKLRAFGAYRDVLDVLSAAKVFFKNREE